MRDAPLDRPSEDLNPRSPHFVRFNLALNGLTEKAAIFWFVPRCATFCAFGRMAVVLRCCKILQQDTWWGIVGTGRVDEIIIHGLEDLQQV